MSQKLISLLKDGTVNGMGGPARMAVWRELHAMGQKQLADDWRTQEPMNPGQMLPQGAVRSFVSTMTAAGLISPSELKAINATGNTTATASASVTSATSASDRPLKNGTTLTRAEALARYDFGAHTKDFGDSDFRASVVSDNQPGCEAWVDVRWDPDNYRRFRVKRQGVPQTQGAPLRTEAAQETDDFCSIVRGKLAAGVPKVKAISQAKEENPQAFREWLAAGGSASFDLPKVAVEPEPAHQAVRDFSAIVEAKIQAGESKTEAIQAAIAQHPAEYEAWKLAGGQANFGQPAQAPVTIGVISE